MLPNGFEAVLVPDLSNLLSPSTIESVVIAAAAWAYFAFFTPYMARRAGVTYEEPPLWLYGKTFNAIRWILLLAFLALAVMRPLTHDVMTFIPERPVSLGLSLIYDLILGGALFGILTVYRRIQAQRQAVVIEPLTFGSAILRGVVVLLIAGVLIGVPVVLESVLGIPLVKSLFGGGEPGSYNADLSLFFGLLLTFVLFWLIPEMIADRLQAQDGTPVWARSTGLEFFRWNLTGLILFASIGLLAAIPGADPFFNYPLSWVFGVLVPVIGAVIFLIVWVAPQRSLAQHASEGEFLAKELLTRVRFSGVVAWLAYRGRSHGRSKGLKPDDEKRLCPTCLRPINDITLYRDLKFDHCPNCHSFIPPLFTMLDFVKHQANRLAALAEDQGPPGAIGKSKKKRARSVDEERLVQDLLKAIFAMAVSERGTDLHLIVEGDKLAVRCRTDGVLYTMVEFDKSMARSLISSVKVMANLDITERRKPQDGSFKINIGDRDLDVRVNTSPVPDGEMAAMRLLYLQDVLGSIEKLGMGSRNIKNLKKLIHNPSGLILLTGPTGSGKTTTLYNALEAIATGERNIVTLEDPIEYQIKGLTQMQINPSKGFTFATGLRTILRQDPDVIMVGEIRDTETAKMAIDAAATGHLVFSTIHATDSVGVVGRLIDLQIDPKRVADVTLLFLAQRLIRLNCPKCCREYPVTRQELEQLGIQGAPQANYVLRRGDGCPHCHETGFFGREGIYEFFVPNDEIRHLISQQAPTPFLHQRSRALGMRTLLEDGLVKVLLGRTTTDELMRVTS